MSFNPDWRVAPGETIMELLDETPVTFADLAAAIHPYSVEELLRGDLVVDAFVARQLEGLFGISAQFWLNYETNYRRPIT